MFGSNDKHECHSSQTGLSVRYAALVCDYLDATDVNNMYSAWDVLQWLQIPRQHDGYKWDSAKNNVYQELADLGISGSDIDRAFEAGYYHSSTEAVDFIYNQATASPNDDPKGPESPMQLTRQLS